jgi:hypothetical protein
MANQEVKRLFFVCDGWDERDGDDRLFYMLLRYHLRGLINAPAWVDRADFSVEIVAEKVLTSALTVVIYSAGEPDCERLIFGPKCTEAIKVAQEYGSDYVVVMPLVTFSSLTKNVREAVDKLADGEDFSHIIESTSFPIDGQTSVPLRHLTPSFDTLMNKIVNVETAKDE